MFYALKDLRKSLIRRIMRNIFNDLYTVSVVVHIFPRKLFLSQVSQTAVVANIKFSRAVASHKITEKGSILFYINNELIFYYQRVFFI